VFSTFYYACIREWGKKVMSDEDKLRRQEPAPLQVAGEGLLAGMGGALALTAMMLLGRKAMAGASPGSGSELSERETRNPERGTRNPEGEGGLTAGEALSEGPSMPPSMSEITATFVQKVATGLFGAHLSREQQYVAGVAWHLAYGGFWGMLYALLQSSVRVPRLLLSLLYGLGVWAIGPGWLVPKMKIMLPPDKQDPRTLAVVAGGHAAYGALLTLGLRLMRGKDRG
jgi:hypothetical protein